MTVINRELLQNVQPSPYWIMQGIVQNRFEIIFEFCSQQKNILLGLTNRLVPKVFENSNEKLVKINREVQKFEKMQFLPG